MARSIIVSRKHARGMAIAAAGIAYDLRAISGVLFVLLRHTAASWMVMRGAGLKDVQEILGHADYKMTQRHAHLSPCDGSANFVVDAYLSSTKRRMSQWQPFRPRAYSVSIQQGS